MMKPNKPNAADSVALDRALKGYSAASDPDGSQFATAVMKCLFAKHRREDGMRKLVELAGAGRLAKEMQR